MQQAKVAPRSLFMIGALLLVSAFFSGYGQLGGHELGFLSARNLSLLSTELASSGVLALGMLMVILPGHIDLAAGSSVGLTGGVAAMLVIDPSGLLRNVFGLHVEGAPAAGLPTLLAMVLTVAASVLLYALVGMLVAHQRMPAFIVTLGGLLAFKGLHWLVIANATVPVAPGGASNAFSALTTAYVPSAWAFPLSATLFVLLASASALRLRRQPAATRDVESWLLKWVVAGQLLAIVLLTFDNYRGVPVAALILLFVAGCVQLIIAHTTFGRYLYAIGGNEQAARLSGIRVERTTILAFASMGAIAGLSGLLQTSYAGSSTTTIGQLMELDAVAACVIGGASLKAVAAPSWACCSAH